MTLIVLLLTIGCEWFLQIGQALQRRMTLFWYFDWMIQQGARYHVNAWLMLSVLLMPWVILVVVIQYLLSGVLFDLLTILLSTFMLLVVVRYATIKGSIDNLVDRKSELGVEDLSMITRVAQDYLFTPLFYFALFGMIGAVVSFLMVQLGEYLAEKEHDNRVVESMVKPLLFCYRILSWLPVRVVGLSYALVGHFAASFNYWLVHLMTGLEHSDDYANQVLYLALNEEKTAQTMQRFIERALVAWIIVIALIVVI